MLIPRRCTVLPFLLLLVSLAAHAETASLSLEIVDAEGKPRPGQVFLDGEAPTLKFNSPEKAAEAAYTITDYFGHEVLKGTLALKDGLGALALPNKAHGYFWISAQAGAVPQKSAFSCYCVIAPYTAP